MDATIAEESYRHQCHNPQRIVSVVSAHNARGDEQTANNRRFARHAQREAFFHQFIRQPAGEQAYVPKRQPERYVVIPAF